MPERLRINYDDVVIDIKVGTAPFSNLPALPGGNENADKAFLIEGLGVLPGSATRNSTYIFGHSWQELPEGVLPRPFTPLSNHALRGVDRSAGTVDMRGTETFPVRNVEGLEVALDCADATLTYEVSEAFTVPKPQLQAVQRVYNDDPGSIEAGNPSRLPNRLVLVTCAADEAVGDLEDSVVFLLYLISVTPR